MPRFVLHHHAQRECGVVFASWKGYKSLFRRRATLASCAFGDHAIWWTVEAASEADALELRPQYVAERTAATPVSEVEIR
jgi:hypothetical protein